MAAGPALSKINAMEEIRNYVAGKLTGPVSGQYLDNYNPAEGKVYSSVPDSDERDVAQAFIAAQHAFAGWSSMPAGKRSQILLKLADLIDRDLGKLALAESIDNCKPVEQALSLDIPRASANICFFATAILQSNTESILTATYALNSS